MYNIVCNYYLSLEKGGIYMRKNFCRVAALVCMLTLLIGPTSALAAMNQIYISETATSYVSDSFECVGTITLKFNLTTTTYRNGCEMSVMVYRNNQWQRAYSKQIIFDEFNTFKHVDEVVYVGMRSPVRFVFNSAHYVTLQGTITYSY